MNRNEQAYVPGVNGATVSSVARYPMAYGNYTGRIENLYEDPEFQK